MGVSKRVCWKELEFQLGDWRKGPSEHKVYYYIVYHSREENKGQYCQLMKKKVHCGTLKNYTN